MVDRLSDEYNPSVKDCLEKDINYLDNIQIEMSTARQFMFSVRFRKEKEEQIFSQVNKVEKAIAEQGFEVKRMNKEPYHLRTQYERRQNVCRFAEIQKSGVLPRA